MSLFSQDERSTASVRALTPLILFELTRVEFNDLLHRQPDVAYALVGMLSERLEQSENTTIQDLREKNRQLTQAYQELQAAQAQIIEKERLQPRVRNSSPHPAQHPAPDPTCPGRLRIGRKDGACAGGRRRFLRFHPPWEG